MKSVVMEKEAAVKQAAAKVKALLEAKPAAVIAAAGGRSTMALYKELADECEKGEISFENASIFLVADFDSAPEDLYIKDSFIEEFIDRIDIYDMNVYYINSLNYQIYSEVIEAKGGLDMCILGIGDNCHIGFNEPGTQFSTGCRRQKLTDTTREQYSWMFGGAEQVPEYAYTMGIKDIYEAREHMVLAFGAEKAESVFKMFYGRNDSRYPAAFLQLPRDVEVYLDPAAAAKLISEEP